MTKGNVLDTPGAVATKDSRTQKLLEKLKVDETFLDPKLPKGFFSNSQYNSWLICGKMYEFKYVQLMSSPGSPSTARGSAVHEGAEYLLRAKMANTLSSVTVEMGKEVVSKSFEKNSESVLEWEDVEPGKMKDAALELYRLYAVHALPKINPVAVEKGFAKKIGDVPMIGWIDLLDEQPALQVPGMSEEDMELAPKRVITADLKTGAAKWSENEIANDPQLTLYSMVEGTPDVRIDLLKSGKKVSTFEQFSGTRTPAHGEVLVDHLNEVADFVKKGVFPKTPIDNWACNEKKCSYYALCRGKKK